MTPSLLQWPGAGLPQAVALLGLPNLGFPGPTASEKGKGNDPLPFRTEGIGNRAEGAIPQARVLVVEDEALVAWEISDMLRDLGHLVCGVAATAEEAVHMAAAYRPDLILMDVTLKGPRDGIDAAAEIQAGHSVRILYVTAHSDPVTRARMEATDPVGILHKPYTDGEMGRVITAALAERSRS